MTVPWLHQFDQTSLCQYLLDNCFWHTASWFVKHCSSSKTWRIKGWQNLQQLQTLWRKQRIWKFKNTNKMEITGKCCLIWLYGKFRTHMDTVLTEFWPVGTTIHNSTNSFKRPCSDNHRALLVTRGCAPHLRSHPGIIVWTNSSM